MHGTPHIVSDVMTHTVAAIGRGSSFKEIVRMMQDWKVSALPVLEGEGRVVGVVSEADLLHKEEFRDSDPDRHTQLQRLSDLAKAGAVTAGELMTSPPLTVRANATLAQAARTMAHGRLLLVQAGGLTGRLGVPRTKSGGGWPVLSCAGHRQARTASRGTPRRRASSTAKRTAADSFASSPRCAALPTTSWANGSEVGLPMSRASAAPS
ncbi:CBS domain-containing protein [Streptomyces collinus]|uniref:CBS domain-containing protein n=1 Tax=Streptomyces collinus TaxID=42684 RepID=UPI0034027D4A